MKRKLLSVITVAVAFIGMPVFVDAAIIEAHVWNLGDNDPGAVDAGAANDPTVAAVGGYNLSRTGAPTYTTTPSGLGIDFGNAGPNFNVPASNFYASTDFSFTPADPTKAAVHARVKLNTEITTESAVFHIGYGNTNGVIVQTNGGIPPEGSRWAVHIPGVFATAGGNQSNAVGQYVDLVLAINGTQLQLWEGTNLVIDFAAGFTSLDDIRIGASADGNRGWAGQIDFVRVLEYTGDFDINAVLTPIPEPSGLVLAGMGLMGLFSMRRRNR